MKITVAGFGTGGAEGCLPAVSEAIARADIVIASPRLLRDAGIEPHRAVPAVRAEDILRAIEESGAERACVLMSGDSGFFSGARLLLPLLEGHEVELLPGVGSVSALSAATGLPWQDWRFCSAHGNFCNPPQEISRNEYTFFITGGEENASAVCRALDEAGFGPLEAIVGCDLGYPRQRVTRLTVSAAAQAEFSPLAVLLVHNPKPYKRVSAGFPDDSFIRGDVPMTKSEVRSAVLSKLRLNSDSVLFDIGAGTGSVACEAALLMPKGRVFAVERKSEGIELISENAAAHGCHNLECVAGEAPEALEGLPAPNAAFIGGSGGRLHEICDELIKLNPDIRIVMTAVSLETAAEASRLMELLFPESCETVMMQISRVRRLGGYGMLNGQNPVFIISGGGPLG